MIPDALRLTADRILGLKHPEDLFGAPCGPRDVQRVYRQLVHVVSPDKYARDADAFALASDVFRTLTGLKGIADAKIGAGTYGNKAAPPPAQPQGPLVVLVRGKPFSVLDKLYEGDLSDVHDVSYEDGCDAQHDLIKIALDPADNDLIESEAGTLRHLDKSARPGTSFPLYYAKLIASLVIRDAAGKSRRANVVQRAVDFAPLADVLKACPDGIDFRDATWMLKRWMVALGYAHSVGVVHGAVLPPHLLMMPDVGSSKRGHAGKVIDWAYAVRTGSAIKAISAPYRDWYAPEVLGKGPVTPATDAYMLGRCALALMNKEAPRGIAEFWARFVRSAPERRPQDLWRAHDEYEAVLKRIVGAPSYRLFHMPPTGP